MTRSGQDVPFLREAQVFEIFLKVFHFRSQRLSGQFRCLVLRKCDSSFLVKVTQLELKLG